MVLPTCSKCALLSHHAGQMCTAGSRIYVQEGIYDEFMKHFIAIAQSAKTGNGFDPNTSIDPVVSKVQLDVGSLYVALV
jgi:aldehyde dehydrogenase (NAD+)